jgi:hypothetical protein
MEKCISMTDIIKRYKTLMFYGYVHSLPHIRNIMQRTYAIDFDDLRKLREVLISIWSWNNTFDDCRCSDCSVCVRRYHFQQSLLKYIRKLDKQVS